MKHVLLTGPVDVSVRHVIDQLSRREDLALTVYTASRVTLPENVVALTQEPSDEGGLSAAMVGQDVVVALLPTIQLTSLLPTVLTAGRAVAVPQLVVGRTDDMDELLVEQRAARRQLQVAPFQTDWVDGLAGVLALLEVFPEPAVAVPRDPAQKNPFTPDQLPG
ncbi:hypothetical protein [Levilactobacillus spicheri]|uniref:Flavoprotein domain-containing protein n=1 Tax=Levilactobacillus spicheri TaxID=216463 RepID=A0ABQ0WS53_9LACO|nr:hypothetical protein [Levilactobacillus spicheri]GEO66355.1 hypothetical protein LSP04_07740 [Levilactobacillus spicheri]